MKRRLLPVMQASKPRPNLTFTYEPPPQTPHPNYRMVLIFNAANDLNASRVCSGEIRHKPEPTRPFDLYAIYCRDDLPLSYTTAWTEATGPDDPRVGSSSPSSSSCCSPTSRCSAAGCCGPSNTGSRASSARGVRCLARLPVEDPWQNIPAAPART